jgi:ABC-type spermidine/putrescine transport system permease subunit II
MKHGRQTWGGWVALGVACALCVGVVGPVLVPMAAGMWRGRVAFETGSWRALMFTVLVSLSIGVMATAAAWWPTRVLAAGRGRLLAGLMLVPVFMPPYLAFSGYGLLRDPSWVIGDWLTGLAASGHAWVTIGVGRGLALFGLALWSWPIATLILWPGMSRGVREVDDALRLDAGLVRREAERLRLHAGGVLASVGTVSLMMMGSALPLHLAQVETMSIGVWRRLFESRSEDWGGVWVSAWPVFVLALAGGSGIAWWLARREGDGVEVGAGRSGGAVRVFAAWVWCLSVLVPLGLFLWSIRSVGSLWEFWQLSGAAVGHGAVVSLVDAALGFVIGVVAACAIGTNRGAGARRVVLGLLWLWIVVSLVPGVIIGSALARVGGWAEGLVVIGHLARFGCVGMVAGCIAGWSEPRVLRDLRVMDGGAGVAGWWHAVMPGQWLMLLGAGLAVGMMGFHEVEATMLVQPPGRANLAQQILGYLHFSRLEELSAAAAWLLGGGLLVSAAASWTIVGMRRGIRTRETGRL